MTELRNLPFELHRFKRRVLIMGGFIGFAFCLVLLRLSYLQIVRHDDLAEQAENNRTAIVPTVPNRGQILDRNGVVLASNYPAYALEITPALTTNLKQTIEALSQLLPISAVDIKRFERLREESKKGFDSLPLKKRLSDQEVALFAAQQYRFPGVQVKARLYRNYPFGETASHAIGYIGRINERGKQTLQEDEASAANYRGTDHIGKEGIERAYETALHGITGVDALETSAGGKATRLLTSSLATPGDNMRLTLDIKLQNMIEDLFGTRRGALVAIDPRNGEVLALVSKPTYDPNLFVDGIDTASWQQLNESLNKPLLDRALRGTYPPGSTYKPFMGLAALELGKRTPDQIINDPGFWMFGNHNFRGHAVGAVNMHSAIVHSSNTYFFSLANVLGAEMIHDFMAPLGFGERTGIDIDGEVRGVLPNQAWKSSAFKDPQQQKWLPGDTISLGIGQGFNNFTMLQLAQATSIVANGGTRHTPHLLMRRTSGLQNQAPSAAAPQTVPQAPLQSASSTDVGAAGAASMAMGYKPENIRIIQDAMVGVTQQGTSAGVFAGATYKSAGKTGTAQATTIAQNQKYNAGSLSEFKRDHSLYIAYAPAENPTIALAIIVENAGFGAEHAAPITRRVFDYWINGEYPSEADIAAVQKGQAARPLGKPRRVADIVMTPAAQTSAP